MKREEVPTAVEIDKKLTILEQFSDFNNYPANRKTIHNIIINDGETDAHVVKYYNGLTKAGITEKDFDIFFASVEAAYKSLINNRMVVLKQELAKL